MKKYGFTIMEILLTIAIIGVIGTLLAKVIAGVMPDINKAKFLRAYVTSQKLIGEILNDSTLYPDDDTTSEKYGFGNTDAPLRGIYASETYSGAAKFPLIFADQLGVSSSSVTSEGGGYSFYSTRDNVEYRISGSQISFYTKINGEDTNLGSISFTNDGQTSCSSDRKYCDDITDLKRNFKKSE